MNEVENLNKVEEVEEVEEVKEVKVQHKNLANCKPSEFLAQTWKIKKQVEKWLKLTNILEIRKNMPKLTPITKTMTEEEKAEVLLENKKKTAEQIRVNGLAILDEVMGEHAHETLAILALCCFVEPSKVDDYDMAFYLQNFTELLQSEAVISFFTTLARLEQITTK